MKHESRIVNADLAIIGAGIAGFAASTFAIERGIKTAQTGNTGALAYTTGYFDLMGTNASDNKVIDDPWTEIESLRRSNSNHPLAKVSESEIKEAFTVFTKYLGQCGVSYSQPEDNNLSVLTPAGTTKKTLCVPTTVQPGIVGYTNQLRCVIIDFKGLKGFSGKQIGVNLGNKWAELRAEKIVFPGLPTGETYPEVMARALEVDLCRQELAEKIKEVAGDAQLIGLPAILGVHNPDKVAADLSRRIGLPVFEIPTMPPAVPGIRLREIFEQTLPQKGLTIIPQQKVKQVEFGCSHISLLLSDNFGPITIKAKTALLATGRFLSGGLEACMKKVTEPLINLPVTQPSSRESWYRKEYLGLQGHEINKCGIQVDESFRPLNNSGEVYDKRLFAAGVILAEQDWIRNRCGAGIAIASAYRAVSSVQTYLTTHKTSDDQGTNKKGI